MYSADIEKIELKMCSIQKSKKRLAYYNGLLCFLGDAAMTICGTTINYHQWELEPLKVYFLEFTKGILQSLHIIFSTYR